MRNSFLPFSTPTIGEEEVAEVVDSLRSGWITTGPKTKRFEKDFAEYITSKHAIAVSSCTDGLHLALAAMGVGPGDEVIVPTLTFCSAVNVVIHLGARPVLVDVGQDFNVQPECIERAITPRTKVIMPMHYAGQACDLAEIYQIAERRGISLVEDAAHAVGSVYHGVKVGSDALGSTHPRLQRATAFSFYPTKNMTTGEGGMVATADDALAERIRLLSLHGMTRDAWKRYSKSGSWYYEVVLPGYKDNMTDIQAAMGIHQLKKLDAFIRTRQQYARMYDDAFGELPQVEPPLIHADRNHIYHIYVLRLRLEHLTIDRANFIEELYALNVGTSVHFIPIHLHPYYRNTFGYKQGDLPNAEFLYERIVSLPLFPRMTCSDVQDVIAAVKTVLGRKRL